MVTQQLIALKPALTGHDDEPIKDCVDGPASQHSAVAGELAANNAQSTAKNVVGQLAKSVVVVITYEGQIAKSSQGESAS